MYARLDSSSILKLSPSQPKFLSREERATLAIQKRSQEIKEQKEKDEKQRHEREALEKQADELHIREQRDAYGGGRYGGGNGRCKSNPQTQVGLNLISLLDDERYSRPPRGREDRDRPPPPSAPRAAHSNGIPTGPRADRSKLPPTSAPGSSAPALPVANTTSQGPQADVPFVPPMTENDLTAIRSRYLGVDKKKRKIRKMNDKKFVFDWDEQEDTDHLTRGGAADLGVKNSAVMFGRGHLAGMDGGSARGESGSERRVIESVKVPRAAVDERHWSEKPLSEMKERDWRIFREDFSIAARGQHGAVPSTGL